MSGDGLAGCRVLVTRPKQQADELCAAIEAAGGEAVHCPVIRITPRDAATVKAELAGLPRPAIVIFISRNAVEHGLHLFRERDTRIAAVGPSTAAAIRNAGADVDIDPGDGFDSEHLLQHAALQDVDGLEILIVRGDGGRQLLGDSLMARGANVSYLAAYRRERNELSAAEAGTLDTALQKGRVDCIIAMSPETLRSLVSLLPPESIDALRKTPLVAPGERVIQTASELVPGMPAILAPGPGVADIINTLECWWHSGRDE